jgi:hypothetical protein
MDRLFIFASSCSMTPEESPMPIAQVVKAQKEKGVLTRSGRGRLCPVAQPLIG